jgi:hypothetical protein
MEGKFAVSSGRMTGSYKERTYEYEVIQVDKETGETITGKEIDSRHLEEADRIFFTVNGGHIEEDKLYRWIAGPFPDKHSMEAAIEDMMLFGSP